MGTLGAAKDSNRDDWSDLELEYYTVQPNRWTFQSDKISLRARERAHHA